jgi:proline iminopeptidase
MHVRPDGAFRRTNARMPLGVVGAATTVALAAAAAGWLIPRGPVTTPEAVITLLTALGVGLATGWLMRSRWALLLAPLACVLVFELARNRVSGPTVDGVRVDGLYGVIALLGGRGIDALLMLLPLTVGVSYGATLAKRFNLPIDQQPVRHWLRRGLLAFATLAVLALMAGLLRPATTAAIVDASGRTVPGSIAQLVKVPIGGHDQSIMLRGVSSKAPVLLFLEGGQGGTDCATQEPTSSRPSWSRPGTSGAPASPTTPLNRPQASRSNRW